MKTLTKLRKIDKELWTTDYHFKAPRGNFRDRLYEKIEEYKYAKVPRIVFSRQIFEKCMEFNEKAS